IGEIGEISLELLRCEHPLVDQGAGGEAADVKGLPVRGGERTLQHSPGRVATDQPELALKVETGLKIGTAPDEKLEDGGLTRPRGEAQIGMIGGHLSPPDQRLAMAAGGLFNEGLAETLLVASARKKDHSDCILSRFGEFNVQLFTR